jgi:hypothetical protein
MSEHCNAQDGEHLPLLLKGDAHRLERAVQFPAVVGELVCDLFDASLAASFARSWSATPS